MHSQVQLYTNELKTSAVMISKIETKFYSNRVLVHHSPRGLKEKELYNQNEHVAIDTKFHPNYSQTVANLPHLLNPASSSGRQGGFTSANFNPSMPPSLGGKRIRRSLYENSNWIHVPSHHGNAFAQWTYSNQVKTFSQQAAYEKKILWFTNKHI